MHVIGVSHIKLKVNKTYFLVHIVMVQTTFLADQENFVNIFKTHYIVALSIHF